MSDVEQAKHEIAIAAKDAVDKIASAAATALKVTNANNSNDHDCIVTLVANFKTLKESQDDFHKEIKESLKDLKDNYSEKILESKKRIDNHESRVLSLEESRAETKGKASTVSVVVAYIFTALALLLTVFSLLKN